MSKTLKAYYQEGFEQLADLVQQAQGRITTNLDKTLNDLIAYDEVLAEELDLYLSKNRWLQSKKAFNDGVVTAEKHEVLSNQLVKAILAKLSALRKKIKEKDLDLPVKDCQVSDGVLTYLDQSGAYSRLFWMKKMMQRSRCVAQLCDADGAVIGCGLLLEGNTFVTTSDLIPNASTVENYKIKIDFLWDGAEVFLGSLSPKSWRADHGLQVAAMNVIEPLSTWNVLHPEPAIIRSNQLLFSLSGGSDDQLTGLLSQSRLLQYQGTFLVGEDSPEQILPGTPIFDESGNWLGIHHGGDRYQATTASEINHFLQGATEEDEPASEEKEVPAVIEEGSHRFNEYHQFTCNRVEHYDRFVEYVNGSNALRQKDIHFFYLHGGEFQAHVGLFNRFVLKLEGRDQDHINIPKSRNRVWHKVIPFPDARRSDDIKLQLPLKVLKAFGLEEPQIEKISEKQLSDILNVPNSSVYQWEKGDKVCLLIKVEDLMWDKDVTPEVATWFIEDFCQKALPDNSPEFFIFFAIYYEDEEDEALKSEVLEALGKGSYIEHFFPELQMVQPRDIKAWFAEYAVYWDYDRKAMRQTRNRYFEDLKEPQDMDDVQKILEQVISEINENIP